MTKFKKRNKVVRGIGLGFIVFVVLQVFISLFVSIATTDTYHIIDNQYSKLDEATIKSINDTYEVKTTTEVIIYKPDEYINFTKRKKMVYFNWLDFYSPFNLSYRYRFTEKLDELIKQNEKQNN